MENIYHMKSIYKKVRFSSFFLLILFLSLISGLFRDVITLFLIIIIHETGHVIISAYYDWKIKRIDITICGGFITYDEVIDKPLKEELIIALAGFIFQLILFVISFSFYHFNIFDIKVFLMINKYNLSIFLFNILPIHPLDGSKILLVFFNYIMPYKKALKLINIVSFVSLILIISSFFIFEIRFEYSYIMIMSFILSKIIKLIKDVPHLFNRFLFERYAYGTNVKKYVHVKNSDLSNFRRGKKHYFLIDGHYYDERRILSKHFVSLMTFR